MLVWDRDDGDRNAAPRWDETLPRLIVLKAPKDVLAVKIMDRRHFRADMLIGKVTGTGSDTSCTTTVPQAEEIAAENCPVLVLL